MSAQHIRFGAFTFDPVTLELFKDGDRLRVPTKPMKLLFALLERPGEMLTRDQLRQSLWPADTFVDFDNNLNAAIRKLREVLEDSATEPVFIETLPRRGYRFVGIVKPVAERPSTGSGQQRPRARLAWALPAAMVIVSCSLAISRFVVDDDMPIRVAVLPFQNLSGDSEQDYVAEGLYAELAAQLRAVAGERVELVAGLEGERSPDFVVAGSSRRDATGLYVTASLVRDGGAQIWADSFACPRQDLFAIQRQLATKIGHRVSAALTDGSE
jgi:DNA-binding winged helix-turn-helix (wHTH) protein/TolB-like protein